ncbi:hypothetical protein ACFVFS_29955 [Kitasatospora sp. NPDC057692]|uniref:hypothetical protein n=1 Tax=Kitasatospora sp. NPDC057692 TaxID=3346215 RepID=UPI0036C04779
MSTIKSAAVALAALTVVGLGASPALARDGADTMKPAPQTCNASGGTFYCGGDYGDGKTYVTLADGTKQLFVIGTDHNVWTTWTPPRGSQAPWMSLGGTKDFVTKVKIVNKKGDAFSVASRSAAINADYYRDRSAGGAWSGWWTYAVPRG